MAVRTIFVMAEDCAASRAQGWREFVRDYADIARQLLTQYFPSLAAELETHVVAVFQRARALDNAWFRQLRFTNEREFAMAFRALVFAYGREAARLPVPEISPDQVRELMRDLPLVEREMLWLFIKGYGAARIADIMMNAEATAHSVKQVADERLRQIVPAASPDALVLSARALIEAAEKLHTEQCPVLKMFNNLINGQVTWRERELTEQHVAGCLSCLDRFTSFQEMIRLRKDAPPLAEREVEPIVAQLALPPEKSGIFARLFGS